MAGAAAGAGVEVAAVGVAVAAVPGVTAFLLCFFTWSFLTAGAEVLVVPAAGAGALPCAAKDMPAAASVSESPRIVEVIFVMVLSVSFGCALLLRF